MAKDKILVTAALPYINNVPHMGHIVGSHLPADIFYRYCRTKGYDAIFVGGSDEHGTPSAVAAKELGLHPQQLVDRLHEIHKKVYERLNIDYSNYSRTSNQSHHETVKEFFRTIYEKGHTHTGKVDMYFCENDGMFLPDRFVIGTCPKCGYESANADQCESCTSVLTPNELVDPHCKSCGSTPVIKQSEHLYLDLGQLAERLNQWVEKQKDVWRPHVYSEAKKWINEGLRSRSITRDMDWGIKVPVEGGLENKIFYVWFDAPIGYMTFTRELGQEIFDEYWKNPESKIFHFLGKDNIPFHTIFWPAMLLAHDGFNLPSNVVGYNYLNFEGQKFSKSKGIGVFCYNLLDSDIDIDVLRSYLTTIIPETKDSDFKWDRFRTTTNAELIGKLGNFFNRTLNLIWKNFDGQLNYEGLSGLNDSDNSLIEGIKKEPILIGDLFFGVEFREAYKRIMQYATMGNVYLDRTAPWNLIKEGLTEEARKTLYLALNLCKSLAIVSSPILPDSMQRLWSEQLNLPGSLTVSGIWDEATNINLSSDHRTNKPKPLYERVDDERLEKLEKHFSRPHLLEELVR
jgi:methionyl-tRNA synthetase